MKTIVALVDFSDVAPKVVKQTLALARAFGSEVILLHGLPHQPVVVDVGVAAPTIYRQPGEEEIRADEEKLRQLSEPLASAGVRLSLRQLRHATVEHIVQETERLAADIIIVGSHRHGTLYNLIVGSVTSDVLKHASCPVLVVPDTERTA
jgi:nucleotide-binding universal stress UspA family protein